MHRRSILVSCMCGVAIACHTVTREVPCPVSPGPVDGRSAVAWERGSAAIPVAGSVFRISPYEPLNAALVDLVLVGSDGALTSKRRLMSTDSSGRFAFDSIVPGRYFLRVRRIGFAAVSDTIDVSVGGSVAARVVMAMDRIGFDDCGLLSVKKRVPWWSRSSKRPKSGVVL